MSAEFPFIGTIKGVKPETLPIFRTYAWDFERNEFERDGDGKMVLLEKNEALKVWIYKALKTERFSYLGYSWRYGSEIKKYIGKVLSVGERKSELRRGIIESLMVNPYIKSIDKIEFIENKKNRRLEAIIEITTIYGRMRI